jgi:alkaline phosphatase
MASNHSHRTTRALAIVTATIVIVVAAALIAARLAPWEFSLGNLVLRSQRGTIHPFPPPSVGSSPIPAPDRTVGTAPVLPGASDAPAGHDGVARPTNAILIIGDGMGIGQLSTASLILHGPYGEMTLETAPVTGLMKTHAGNLPVTDSAASSTAMATGFKVPKRAIATLADGTIPVTLFEAARRAGLTTGVITTSGLVDATPAGFTAHAAKREHYVDILDDMLASDAELLIGGDWSDYTKALRNREFQARLDNIDALGAAAGYDVVRSRSELAAASGRVLALFPPRGTGGDAHGPALDELARFGIERLDATGNGFVLLIESEITDGTGHDNDIGALVEGVRELDEMLRAVLAWSEPRGDTLVVVTADHDTGGLGVVGGDYDRGVAEVRWATHGHTSQWVPVFAFGPGSEHFSGVIDNTDVGILIARLLDIDGLPSLQP